MKKSWNDRQTTIPLHERPDLDDKEELIELVQMIDFAKQRRDLHEQLWQLHKFGPCWDGDVISKVDRDDLLSIGACAKVVVKGEQGFNGCTYFGHSLLQIYDWLHGPLRNTAEARPSASAGSISASVGHA